MKKEIIKEEFITYIDLYTVILKDASDPTHDISTMKENYSLLKNKYETKYLILSDYIKNLVKPIESFDNDYYYNSIISFCKSMDRNEKLKSLGI